MRIAFNRTAEAIYVKMLRCNKAVTLEGMLRLRGIPIIDIHDDAKLVLGDNVTLTSRNRGYHLSLYSPVKLFADRPNASIRIGRNTRIHGTCVHAHHAVTIGENCLIAANCQIFDANGHDLSFVYPENRIHTTGSASPIIIEDNVWIGAHSIILPGAHVGYGSVIAAGSIVTKGIPPMVVAGGNPARVIRDHSTEAKHIE